jgi:hypothetical protein
MCGYEPMVRVKQYREAVRQALPASTQLNMNLSLTQSGRSVQVFLSENHEHTLMWGYAVNRQRANQLMLRLPKEVVNVRNFVAFKINQAIWGDNRANYYTFTA